MPIILTLGSLLAFILVAWAFIKLLSPHPHFAKIQVIAVATAWVGWAPVCKLVVFPDHWQSHGMVSSPLGGVIMLLFALGTPLLLAVTFRHIRYFLLR
jgi:hypothetical protein